MKVYYYIPIEEHDASAFRLGRINITHADFENEIFEFDLNKESVAELVDLASYRGTAIEITKEQYFEALGNLLETMAGGNPCSFNNGEFSVSSESFSQISCFLNEFPQARKGEFVSDGERYYSVSISFNK